MIETEPTREEALALYAVGMRVCWGCDIMRPLRDFAVPRMLGPLCVYCQDADTRAYYRALVAQWLAEGKQKCSGPCQTPRPLSAFYTKLPSRSRDTRCKDCTSLENARRRKASNVARTAAGAARLAYVYRLYDGDGALLYIGKTWNVGVRVYWGPSSHAVTKPWFPEVRRLVVQTFRSDDEALTAEAHAIHAERPAHNVVRPRLHALGTAPAPLCEISGEVV